MAEWLIPFAGRNQSLSTAINFLWRDGSLFIMDNHRAAAWCWLQHLGCAEPFVVFHVDAHYDTAGAGGRLIEGQPKTSTLSLPEYLDAYIDDSGDKIAIYRWDNYISLLHYHHSTLVAKWYFATHGIGQQPDFEFSAISAGNLLKAVSALQAEKAPVVLNIDLDYFRSVQGDRFPPEARAEFFQRIAELRASDRIAAITVCLSPECCGSWSSAEELLREFTDALGVTFSLPAAA
jgi:hypothetical protein